MLIIAHATIVRVSHHAIAGGITGVQINPPLKIVAISASPMKIARTAIDIVSVLLTVTRCHGLALTIQVCAISMSSVTMNTSTGAIQIELVGMNLAQVTAATLSTGAIQIELVGMNLAQVTAATLSTGAIQIELVGMNLAQVTAATLSTPVQPRNPARGINTGALSHAVLIAMLDRLTV